ncbi:hypothetical protein Y032_0612g663 [Ancylostoma ceylanicum]|uniref:MYND-type domain-containing protein n=1 Tax=Ancylostoma ceylanicum TaxID=53326 RepID=A0A016WN27_9BILA|nr:hypothetical protein Y032_0612g663 [Ancylostoma ceylanicum]
MAAFQPQLSSEGKIFELRHADEMKSLSDEAISSIQSNDLKQRPLPGYTVSDVPKEWIVGEKSRIRSDENPAFGRAKVPAPWSRGGVRFKLCWLPATAATSDEHVLTCPIDKINGDTRLCTGHIGTSQVHCQNQRIEKARKFNNNSRVVEVVDTFAGSSPLKGSTDAGNVAVRYGGRVTIEEVLDSIFQQTSPAALPYVDSSITQPDIPQKSEFCPGIYSGNSALMQELMKNPSDAELLLKSEQLFVRCSYCHKTRELALARLQYVTCKHCYTYYCSKECRLKNWEKHSNGCSFARINTLCKDVIMKVREDPLAQASMSKLARMSYTSKGRGSVNIRLSSPHIAQAYVNHGWSALSMIPQQRLLHYYTIAALVRERKEPSLVALCRRYDPREKFILSVSIIADIEHCPQTPPPETADWNHSLQGVQGAIQTPSHVAAITPASDMFGPLTLVPTNV